MISFVVKATLPANTYPISYPKNSNTKPINVDKNPANFAANKPTIAASTALDSALDSTPNNPPIKLLFVVSTAPNNGASNKYPYFLKKLSITVPGAIAVAPLSYSYPSFSKRLL